MLTLLLFLLGGGKHLNSARNLLLFATLNFGPLVGFYIINNFWGFKVGILVSILLVFIELIWLRYKKSSIGCFFYFSSGVIVIFGTADLFYQDVFFLKYEAVITNLISAGVFGISLLKDKPLVQEIAESQKRTSIDSSPDKTFFFRFFTVFWSLYFLTKAIFYLWMNLGFSLEERLIVRLIVGKMSFWIMMFISVGIPHQIWKMMELLRLFPSQRNARNLS